MDETYMKGQNRSVPSVAGPVRIVGLFVCIRHQFCCIQSSHHVISVGNWSWKAYSIQWDSLAGRYGDMIPVVPDVWKIIQGSSLA